VRLNILFVTWNGTGNLPPELTLARHLARRGHDVRVLAHSSLRPRIEAATLRLLPHDRLPDLYGRDGFSASPDPWWNDVFFSPVSGDDVATALDREPADVVVVDCLLWGDAAASEAAGVPPVIFVHTLYGRFVGDLSGEGLRDRVGTLNRARSRWGLPPVAEPRQAWDTSPCVLVASVRALDLPSPAANVVHVGPLRDDEGAAMGHVPRGRPLVVISFSTSRFAPARLVQSVLDALAELPVQGLLTTGEHLDRAALTVPHNVAVERYVPHSMVMSQADLVITHGGHGTVMAALRAGVPLLCLPLLGDQPFIARRVHQAGAGRWLPPTVEVESIRAALVDVLDSPSYRTKAGELAQAIRTELDPDGAAAVVEAARSAATGIPPNLLRRRSEP
jgi:UDP:flavonoid glycosyltransferase YjiC (YdhE family)